MNGRLFVVVGLVLCGLSGTASAQMTNPGGIEFTPSAEHNTVVGGVAVLDHYEFVTVTTGGNVTTVFTVTIPKTAPDPRGLITARVPQLGTLATGEYRGYVDAVGPGGSARSAPSDPFVRIGNPPPAGAPIPVP